MKKIQYMKPRTTKVNIQNDYLLQATSGRGNTISDNLMNGGLTNNGGQGNLEISYIKTGFLDFN